MKKQTLSALIRERLAACRMSQTELARKAEISDAYLSQLMSGARVPKETGYGRVMAVLGIAPEDVK